MVIFYSYVKLPEGTIRSLNPWLCSWNKSRQSTYNWGELSYLRSVGWFTKYVPGKYPFASFHHQRLWIWDIYIYWLVVWNIFHILGIIIPNWLIFFRGLKPPTSILYVYIYLVMDIWWVWELWEIWWVWELWEIRFRPRFFSSFSPARLSLRRGYIIGRSHVQTHPNVASGNLLHSYWTWP
jgi:hypothetical protein